MKIIKRWKATIKKRGLNLYPVFNNPKLWQQNLLELKDKEVEIGIQKWTNKRTPASNRLYWLWVDLIAKETGEDDISKVHAKFAYMFLMDRSGPNPYVKSTSILDTIGFSEYMGKVERFSISVLNIILPHPEDLWIEYQEEIKSARKK